MLKPITALAVASILFTGASTAQADDSRYDRRGHSHHVQIRHDDIVYLTRAERRDLRRLQRFDRRDLSRAERRYLTRLLRQVRRIELREQRYRQDLRLRRLIVHSRNSDCRVRSRHVHGKRVFYASR